MQKLFVSKRTKTAAWIIVLTFPALLAAYAFFITHRPALPAKDERKFLQVLIANSDLVLALVFLLAAALPFFLAFDKRKPQARELIPIAVMAAMAVVGRAAFAIVPLPNFKPVSAIVIITALAFGPEAGFLTGALSAVVSNFLFGQGPWTPWQMFSWGMIGFAAGIMNNAGCFKKGKPREYFKGGFWKKLCPNGTNRGDMLLFAKRITDHAPLSLCIFGLASGFFYGWFMNMYFIIGYIDPITWQTVLAAYASSFMFDLSHGACTFLVLWALGEPWIRKLQRIKVKFGLVKEGQNYVMPPSAAETNMEEAAC